MQPAHNPDPAHNDQTSPAAPALTPDERVARFEKLLDGEIYKEWQFDDHVVSISATNFGYELNVRGMPFKGNGRHFSFELDQSGKVVSSEARMQIGCLVKRGAPPAESELDQALGSLKA